MGTRLFKLERDALNEISRREQATQDARELRSLQVVRLYGSGEAMERIQQVSGASERSIRRWVERYVSILVVRLIYNCVKYIASSHSFSII